ncbi:sugar-phosphatase [Carnobacterium gallinarum]|uniref:sugar-phosphatase n=1 Tax=Carnobacterium gallinarum TaxID=2749 RepID=UPI000558E8BC|nr:sugar-phosphatase [Carnobacterium gallinarum]
MSIELIAIDLDGTLLTPESKISPFVKETLLKAKEKGIKIVLCTGRPLVGVTKFLEELNLQEEGDFCITYNGALVQSTHDGHAIVHHTLGYSDFLELEALSRKIGVHFQTFDMDHLYTANKDISEYTVHEATLVSIPLKYRAVEEMDQTMEISKMMMIDKPEILDHGIAQIDPSYYDKYTLIKSTDFYFEILNKKANKGNAVADLAKSLNIPAENVMAIGDNENDLAMLEYAHYAIAMGNAVDSVKAISTYVTETNVNDGVAVAIEKFAF